MPIPIKDIDYKTAHASITETFKKNKKLIDDFHRLIYKSDLTWKANKWMGHNALKTPMDLWMLQEIIFEVKPQLIIETGTAEGGTALYMAHLLDIVFKNNIKVGGVITIDLDNQVNTARLPDHERINYVTANSIDNGLISFLNKCVKGLSPVMVILDSDHSADHVYKELVVYSKYVTKGSFLIVEDTNLGTIVQREVAKKVGQKRSAVGPMAGLKKFMKETDKFTRQVLCERFLVTFHPEGWLYKVKD
jgi:cephalosporin hydroxylase